MYEVKVNKRCSVFVTFMRSIKMKARPNLENVRELKMILPWNFTASTWKHNEVSYKSHCCCLFTRLSGLFYDFNWLTIHYSQDWSLMERIQPNNSIIIPTTVRQRYASFVTVRLIWRRKRKLVLLVNTLLIAVQLVQEVSNDSPNIVGPTLFSMEPRAKFLIRKLYLM